MDANATYLHRDQVGSVVMSTLASFTVQQRQYFPYGNKRGGDDFTFEADYTGQRRDDTGLMYYNARYYDPQLGMFISPDTIIPDPTDYFSYNRYLYARGNPLINNDPSGHLPCRPGECVPSGWDGQQLREQWEPYKDVISWQSFLYSKYQYEQYMEQPELLAQDYGTLRNGGEGVAAAEQRLAYKDFYLDYVLSQEPVSVTTADVMMTAAMDVANPAGVSAVSGAIAFFFSGLTIKGPNGNVIYVGDMDLRPELMRIAAGIKDPHNHDSTVFKNIGNPLPVQPLGYYHEYVVRTPGYSQVGPQRLVIGNGGEIYYTPDHYATFHQVYP